MRKQPVQRRCEMKYIAQKTRDLGTDAHNKFHAHFIESWAVIPREGRKESRKGGLSRGSTQLNTRSRSKRTSKVAVAL